MKKIIIAVSALTLLCGCHADAAQREISHADPGVCFEVIQSVGEFHNAASSVFNPTGADEICVSVTYDEQNYYDSADRRYYAVSDGAFGGETSLGSVKDFCDDYMTFSCFDAFNNGGLRYSYSEKESQLYVGVLEIGTAPSWSEWYIDSIDVLSDDKCTVNIVLMPSTDGVCDGTEAQKFTVGMVRDGEKWLADSCSDLYSFTEYKMFSE